MKIIPTIAALFLAGCATSSTVASGPNGQPMHFIKCGSAVLEKCYEKAAELCPGGYDFVDRQNSQNGGIVRTAPNNAFFVAGPQSMAVQCK